MHLGGADQPAARAAGQLVAGRYRIEHPIGEGGFGTVYRATQLDTATEVALKILHQGHAEASAQLRRFQREAELAQQLLHRNVVRTLDHGTTAEGLPFIVFELLFGESLEQRIERAGKLQPYTAAEITVQVLEGLAAAHGMGIVHRDIKPANIFLCVQDGPPLVRVLDFGIAKAIAGDGSKATKLTQTGQLLGTPYYMAPEQVAGAEVTAQTDLYALGLVMVEMLTGQPLATGGSAIEVLMSHVSERPFVLHEDVRGSPLGPVIYQAIKKLPADRWPSAADMLEATRATFAQMKTSHQTEAIAPSLAQTMASGAHAGFAPPQSQPPSTGAGFAPPTSGAPSAPVAAAPPAQAAVFPVSAAPSSDGYVPVAGAVTGGGYGTPYSEPGYHVPYGPPPTPARGTNPAIWMLFGGVIVLLLVGGVGTAIWLSQRGDDSAQTTTEPAEPTVAVETSEPGETSEPSDVQPTPRETGRLGRVEAQPRPKAVSGYHAGQKVMVHWGKKWWPATILAVRGNNFYLIHYDGWGSKWDEVVGPSRIKRR